MACAMASAQEPARAQEPTQSTRLSGTLLCRGPLGLPRPYRVWYADAHLHWRQPSKWPPCGVVAMSEVSSVEPAGGFEFLIMARSAESAIAKGYTFRVPKSAAHEVESRQARLDRWISGLREVAGLSAKLSGVRPPLVDLSTGPNVGLPLFDATGAPIPFAQQTACLPALPRFSSFGTPSPDEDDGSELAPPDAPSPVVPDASENGRSSPTAASPITPVEATEPEPAAMAPSEPPTSPEDAAEDAASAEAAAGFAAAAVSPASADGDAASPESPEDAWLLSPRDLRLRQLTPARLVAAGDASLVSPIPSLTSLGRGGGGRGGLGGGGAGGGGDGERGWVRQLPHGSSVVGRRLHAFAPSPLFTSPPLLAPSAAAPVPVPVPLPSSPASAAAVQPTHRQPRPYVAAADADETAVASGCGGGTPDHEARRRKPHGGGGRRPQGGGGAFVPNMCVQRTLQRIPRPAAAAASTAAAVPAAAAVSEAPEPHSASAPPSDAASSSSAGVARAATKAPAAPAVETEEVDDDEGATLFRRLRALDPAASEDDYRSVAAVGAAAGEHSAAASVWDIEGLLSDILLEEAGGA